MHVVRIARPEDAESASELVQRSFLELSASDWEPAARDVFVGESSPAALEVALRSAAYAAAAFSEATLTGFLLMRKPSLLGMLFVHPAFVRRGIARQLWECARAHIETAFPEVKTIELNATPYAVTFYRSVGFVPISAEFQLGGCRATRMACWLPARGLGAEPALPIADRPR